MREKPIPCCLIVCSFLLVFSCMFASCSDPVGSSYAIANIGISATPDLTNPLKATVKFPGPVTITPTYN